MALALFKTVEIIEVMENYLERIRPPHHIRHDLDIGYKIDGQSVTLFEIRPGFLNPGINVESPYAKATYIKSSGQWKIYWMRANLKWDLYEIRPVVSELKDFLELVEEDKYHCFKG
ncbi:MAG: DUF3024 domain-containing protein [Bacteroidota bacterium]|nr:DUF3024 domain-containing protein [Bacteroidota bacterium]MDP4212450.1 DUF3024 domain-containing protein [Bacteroidota bacterium]MDP4252246.1 DUF3024 domain-containing protein [Bacteroidota bacterium]